MSIPDLLTAPSLTEVTFTTAAIIGNVNEWPNDAERNVFIHSDNLFRIQVSTVFAGMASGVRFEYRFDTQADLASGSHLIVASTEIIPVADMVANARFYLRIPPRRVPSGYDFSGVFAVPESEAASGGGVIVSLVDGAEDMENNTV